MPIKAIMFCKFDMYVTSKVIEKLRELPEIKKLMSLTGDYDAIAEIEVENSEDLYDIFTKKLDKIEGIIDTKTHVVMKSWEK